MDGKHVTGGERFAGMVLTGMEKLIGDLLSKTSFLRGVRCKKSLYLDRNHEDLRDPIDPIALRHMQEGLIVHRLAQGYIPGGVYARDPSPFAIQASLDITEALIQEGQYVLYEAAIRHDHILAFIDVLVRDGDEWELFEVKSAVSVKDHYYWDVAFQVFLLESAGFKVKDASILHIDNEYIRSGELEIGKLFKPVSVLEVIRDLQYDVASEVERCLEVLDGDRVPEVDIGIYCTKPNECDFMGRCWVHIPSPSVFDIYRMTSEEKFKLYQTGVILIDEIPEDYPLKKSSEFHVLSHKYNQEIIRPERIKEFLDARQYPLHFLDFETFSSAIPPYDGLRPYAQIPYQYSLHLRQEQGGDLMHTGYLGEPGSDPREALLKQLLKDIRSSGDVLAYNIGFEKMVLNGLAKQFPAYRDALVNIIDRLVDLIVPFRKRDYYLPEMNGSSSLKSVLPALVPEMNYEALEIGDGMQAMNAYLQLQQESDPEIITITRDALWAYCEQDTLAMVKILGKLEDAAA